VGVDADKVVSANWSSTVKVQDRIEQLSDKKQQDLTRRSFSTSN
jgi:hypothetical protein